MIKLACITLTCILMSWLRTGFGPTVHDDPAVGFTAGCTIVWLVVFGSYFGWLLLLVMVRQLGAAIRGK